MLVLHAIWGFGNKECEKHSKYTHLVRLLCFLIMSVIHEFQYFGILETSPYSRVFAFFALWFWWTIKHSLYTFLIMSFFSLYRVLCIHFRVSFYVTRSKTHKIYIFSNVILFLHIRWFASVFAFFYVNLLNGTFPVILFSISI